MIPNLALETNSAGRSNTSTSVSAKKGTKTPEKNVQVFWFLLYFITDINIATIYAVIFCCYINASVRVPTFS